MSEPIRSIQLAFARLDIYLTFVNSVFLDGSDYGAYAHHTKAYCDLARRTGYGDDIFAYCVDHEFAHHFVAQELYGQPSRVLWPLAHGRTAPRETVLHEEALVIHFQAFLRANVIVPATAPGVDWFALKSQALELLDPPAEQVAA